MAPVATLDPSTDAVLSGATRLPTASDTAPLCAPEGDTVSDTDAPVSRERFPAVEAPHARGDGIASSSAIGTPVLSPVVRSLAGVFVLVCGTFCLGVLAHTLAFQPFLLLTSIGDLTAGRAIPLQRHWNATAAWWGLTAAAVAAATALFHWANLSRASRWSVFACYAISGAAIATLSSDADLPILALGALVGMAYVAAIASGSALLEPAPHMTHTSGR